MPTNQSILLVLLGLEDCPLHKKTPFGIKNVSQTQLSIARHYGGIKYNGQEYTYFPKKDELIRNDVLKWKKSNEKKTTPKEKTKEPDSLPPK